MKKSELKKIIREKILKENNPLETQDPVFSVIFMNEMDGREQTIYVKGVDDIHKAIEIAKPHTELDTKQKYFDVDGFYLEEYSELEEWEKNSFERNIAVFDIESM